MQFSIITPSFRASDWLKLCIASVADQSGVTFEHIVQDSCSDDGTLDWLQNDPRVNAFIEKDSGMYDAINRGLRRASGEICAYLNCDEQYLPGTLAKVAEFFASRPNMDVLFGDVVLVNSQGQPLSYRRVVLPTRRHIRAAHLNTLSSATFFRRTVLERGFYFDSDLKDVGDAVWVEELLCAGLPMATLPFPLAVFAFTGENRSSLPFARQEGVARKADSAPLGALQQSLIILAHRLRKMAAGAYRRRNFEVDVFTLNSPQKRQRRVAKRVGFTWPSRAI